MNYYTSTSQNIENLKILEQARLIHKINRSQLKWNTGITAVNEIHNYVTNLNNLRKKFRKTKRTHDSDYQCKFDVLNDLDIVINRKKCCKRFSKLLKNNYKTYMIFNCSIKTVSRHNYM